MFTASGSTKGAEIVSPAMKHRVSTQCIHIPLGRPTQAYMPCFQKAGIQGVKQSPGGYESPGGDKPGEGMSVLRGTK